MMKPATIAAGCAFAILGLSNGAVADEWASAPVSGTYEAEIYVQSVSGTGCLDKAGFTFIGELSFAGLSGSKHYLRALETGTNFAVDSVQTLAVTHGKGTTSLSGTLTWTGNGVGGSWSESGTFSATVTEIGGHTFVMQMTDVYSGCTAEVLNIALVRMGANQ